MYDYGENTLNDSFVNAISQEQLSNIDSDYYLESIYEQIDDLMGTSTKKNYLKKFEENINKVCESNEDDTLSGSEVSDIKNQFYDKIVTKISNKFGFTVIHDDDYSLKNLAKHMYKFFVLEYTDNIAEFLEMFIVDHLDELAKEISSMKDVSTKKIDELPSNASIIINNINLIISRVIDRDVNFYDMVSYIIKHPDASASADKMLEYDQIFDDTDSIMEYITSSLENEDEGFSSIYTHVIQFIYNNYLEEN